MAFQAGKRLSEKISNHWISEKRARDTTKFQNIHTKRLKARLNLREETIDLGSFASFLGTQWLSVFGREKEWLATQPSMQLRICKQNSSLFHSIHWFHVQTFSEGIIDLGSRSRTKKCGFFESYTIDSELYNKFPLFMYVLNTYIRISLALQLVSSRLRVSLIFFLNTYPH